MAKKVIILKGLPASGKTTWAKDYLKGNAGNCKRVNKDDLRAMLDDGRYSRSNEKLLLKMRDMMITLALHQGKHVIVDDTNLNPVHEETIRVLIQAFNKEFKDRVQVQVKFFDVSPEECVQRDQKRENPVGEKVIFEMAQRWLHKYNKNVPEIDPHNNDLPWCIIYDMDGTAAIIGDRSPYDASKCDVIDRCNYALHEVLSRLGSKEVYIVMSGRPDEYRDPTVNFLNKHDFPWDLLLMRKTGDARKDVIVKKEMYEEYIRGKYNILVVFDDRNQIVDMWRNDIGVPCFQVNDGDF